MGDPIVFRKGTYETSGDGWSATVHVPHDWTLTEFAAAMRPVLGAIKEASDAGRKSDAA